MTQPDFCKATILLAALATQAMYLQAEANPYFSNPSSLSVKRQVQASIVFVYHRF